jgi:WD40 repeat protein
MVSASVDGTVRLWPMTPAPSLPVQRFIIPENRLLCKPSPDFRRLTTVNPANWTFEEWDTASNRIVRSVQIQDTNLLASLSGLPVIYGGMIYRGLSQERQDRAGLLQVSTGGAPGAMLGLTYDGQVLVWSMEKGGITFSSKVAEHPIIAWPSDEGKRVDGIEFVEPDDRPRLFRWLQAGNRRAFTIEDVYGANPLYFSESSDGRWLAYVSTNGYIAVFDTSARRSKPKPVLECPPDGLVRLAFAPRGTLLTIVTGNGDIHQWDAATRRFVGRGHIRRAGAVWLGHTSDGQMLITHGLDGFARLWNFALSSEPILSLPAELSNIWLGIISSDGSALLEPDGTNQFRVIPIPTLAEIDAAEKAQTSPGTSSGR